ncbi:MAG: lysophospholipid acyltransferase family protein [Candidatus Aureabacteria bacterium]|nr:lysophospholipid acyltransferase family protein [Candidatus Auribacterota bacterium]
MATRKLLLQRFLKPIFRFVFRIFGRVRVTGLEHLPAEGGYLLFSNHISWFDPILVGSFIPTPMYFMAMEGLFKFPPLRFLMRKVGAFPVSRNLLDRSAIEEAVAILRRGEVVFIFPEGGIRRMHKGEKVRAGITLIAERAAAPLVPIGIRGCRELYRPRKLLARRVEVGIWVGAPFLVSSISSASGKKLRIAVMERITREMCALSGEDYHSLKPRPQSPKKKA